MSDVISVEGIGTVSLLELVERLSKEAFPNQNQNQARIYSVTFLKLSGRGSEFKLEKKVETSSRLISVDL